MHVTHKLTLACSAALLALVAYAATTSKMLYYVGWLPTAAVAMYYLTVVALEALRDPDVQPPGTKSIDE